MTRLIGLTGYSGAGKDAAAAYLVREHGFTRVAFADPLREMLYALDPLVDGYGEWENCSLRALVDAAGWDVAKRDFPNVRELLQRLGTEAGRAVLGDSIWIDTALRRVDTIRGNIVITDVRFENEAKAIRAWGGDVWRIHRPGVNPVNGHVSDRGLSEAFINRTILNDGTLSDLGYAVFGAITT